MIRRDYVLRQVQELAQVVARALFLRQRQEYQSALTEIGRALQQLQTSHEEPTGDGDSPAFGPEDWIELCRRNEAVTGNLLIAVGDLIWEQGSALTEMGKPEEAVNSWLTAVTLYLEAVLSGAVPVTRELVDRIDQLIESTADASAPPATLARLASYFEQRRRFAQAEDVMFEWMETGSPEALAACREFYQRLLGSSEEELNEGELPRAEVLEGLADVEARAAQSGTIAGRS